MQNTPNRVTRRTSTEELELKLVEYKDQYFNMQLDRKKEEHKLGEKIKISEEELKVRDDILRIKATIKYRTKTKKVKNS